MGQDFDGAAPALAAPAPTRRQRLADMARARGSECALEQALSELDAAGEREAAIRRERDEALQALRRLREQYALCTELARRQTMAMHGLQALARQMGQPDDPAPAPPEAALPSPPAPSSLRRRLVAWMTGD